MDGEVFVGDFLGDDDDGCLVDGEGGEVDGRCRDVLGYLDEGGAVDCDCAAMDGRC